MKGIILCSLFLFVVICCSNGAPVETQPYTKKSARAVGASASKRLNIAPYYNNSSVSTKSYIDTHPHPKKRRHYHKRHHKLHRRRHRHKLVYPLKDRLQYFGGGSSELMPSAKPRHEDFEMTNGEVFEHGGVPDLRHNVGHAGNPSRGHDVKIVQLKSPEKLKRGDSAERAPSVEYFVKPGYRQNMMQEGKFADNKYNSSDGLIYDDADGAANNIDNESTKEDDTVETLPMASIKKELNYDDANGRGYINVVNVDDGKEPDHEEKFISGQDPADFAKETNPNRMKNTASHCKLKKCKNNESENHKARKFTFDKHIRPKNINNIKDKGSSGLQHDTETIAKNELKNNQSFANIVDDYMANERDFEQNLEDEQLRKKEDCLLHRDQRNCQNVKQDIGFVLRNNNGKYILPKNINTVKDKESWDKFQDDKESIAKNDLKTNESFSDLVHDFMANEHNFKENLHDQQLRKKGDCQVNGAKRNCENVKHDIGLVLRNNGKDYGKNYNTGDSKFILQNILKFQNDSENTGTNGVGNDKSFDNTVDNFLDKERNFKEKQKVRKKNMKKKINYVAKFGGTKDWRAEQAARYNEGVVKESTWKPFNEDYTSSVHILGIEPGYITTKVSHNSPILGKDEKLLEMLGGVETYVTPAFKSYAVPALNTYPFHARHDNISYDESVYKNSISMINEYENGSGRQEGKNASYSLVDKPEGNILF